jgi:hypothetical protein
MKTPHRAYLSGHASITSPASPAGQPLAGLAGPSLPRRGSHTNRARIRPRTSANSATAPGGRLKVQPWRSTRLKIASDIAGREIRATIYGNMALMSCLRGLGCHRSRAAGVSGPGPHTIAVMDLIGPDEFTAVVAGARRSLGELAVRVASPVTWADDLCVAVLAWRGRDRTGAVVERKTVETLRLDATGKIAEHWGLEVRCRDAAHHRHGPATLAGRAGQRR